MTASTITLKLVGAPETGGDVDFADFRGLCDAAARCLRHVEAAVTGSTGAVSYGIADLQLGSAVVTLEPVAAADETAPTAEMVGLFHHTVDALAHGKPVDPRLGSDDLRVFRRLIEPIHRKSKEVWVNGTPLTAEFAAHIDEILATSFPSHGRVTGRLERLNLHGRLEFVLYPPIRGFAIRCRFRPELFEDVRRALRRNIAVTGKLFFLAERPFPDRVEVETLEILPRDEELPSLRQLRGMAKACTGEKTSLEFVRALRDE